MEIQLHSTTKVVTLNGIPARVWEGVTAKGIPIHAFITRIAVEKSENLSEFEVELDSASEPSVDVAAYPMHMLI